MTGGALDRAWRDHRSYLVDLAFGMLRDVGEAEDTVQSAFAQLLREGPESIEDARAWLTVVTSRLCLNRIQSAARQRERSVPDEVMGGRPAADPLADPADRVTLDDRVRLALLLVLERLTPAERVAFVLHDVFAVPFDDVAASVGRSTASCRQLAHRARSKLEVAGGRHVDIAAMEHRALADSFIAACAGGDLDGLVAQLDPEVSGDSDYGPFVAHGAVDVATNLLRYWSGQPGNHWGVPVTLVSQPLAGGTALLGYAERRLVAIMLLDVGPAGVRDIHVIGDPGKLGFLRAQLDASSQVIPATGGP